MRPPVQKAWSAGLLLVGYSVIAAFAWPRHWAGGAAPESVPLVRGSSHASPRCLGLNGYTTNDGSVHAAADICIVGSDAFADYLEQLVS